MLPKSDSSRCIKSSPFVTLVMAISRICSLIAFKLLLSIYESLLNHSPSHGGGRRFESGRAHRSFCDCASFLPLHRFCDLVRCQHLILRLKPHSIKSSI